MPFGHCASSDDPLNNVSSIHESMSSLIPEIARDWISFMDAAALATGQGHAVYLMSHDVVHDAHRRYYINWQGLSS